MKAKITILIFSVIYCAYLLAVLAAGHYQSAALNPLNSEYYFKSGLFTQAIEAEPAKAEYHMGYALDLIKKNRAPDIYMKRLILTQLKQAVELKPYNKKYKEIYDTYEPFLINAHKKN